MFTHYMCALTPSHITMDLLADTSAAAAGALEYKLCVHEDNPSFTSGCPYALDVVEQLPMVYILEPVLILPSRLHAS